MFPWHWPPVRVESYDENRIPPDSSVVYYNGRSVLFTNSLFTARARSKYKR